MGVGVLLLRECLDVALTVLVDVIDDPGFLLFALRVGPGALTN
jgi:hypothetical protein